MSFLDIAITAARKAGEIQRSYLGKEKDIEYKDFSSERGPTNLVTNIDQRSEDIIISTLRKQYPEHDILTEESSSHRTDSEYRWIIDPLDGTTNYAHDFPLFCVSIALEYKGDIIAGVVYNATYDELFSAEKNKGAFLNGKPLHVSATETLDTAMLATGFPYDRREKVDHYLAFFKAFMLRSQAIRRTGAAALDCCYLAAGRIDGFWELQLQPWDTAAGMLIFTEAGGQASDFSGNTYSPYTKEIVASNGKIHQEILDVLRSVLTAHEK